MAERKLTPKQQRFVDAYDGNATKAAIAAGYSEKTARRIGHKNMTKVDIIAELQAREDKRRTPTIASREERQAFWTKTMRDVDEKMQDRLRASELLGKSEADFIERQELSGSGGAPLIDAITVKFVDV